MKMGDGGFRLAFNVQFATGNKSKVIFGTDVVNTLDPGTSLTMLQQVHSRLELLGLSSAKTWNADSAYSSKEDVESAAEFFPACEYYSPAKLKKGVDPKKIQKSDSTAVQEWRRRLDTEEMKESYKDRSSTAEFSNAQTKNQGMTGCLVRGLRKVHGMINLHAIAQNISRYWDLMRKKDPQAV